jgi:hypothetical protein
MARKSGTVTTARFPACRSDVIGGRNFGKSCVEWNRARPIPARWDTGFYVSWMRPACSPACSAQSRRAVARRVAGDVGAQLDFRL